MNFVVCDDNPDEARDLVRLLHDSGNDITAKTFTNGQDALDFIHTGAMVDCCILDIVMPEMSGIELARQLRKDGYSGEIIFLSTSNAYGPESYAVNAFTYILKPPMPESVREALGRLVRAKSSADTGSIAVKVAGVARVIRFRDISHVEVIGHNVVFRMTDGSEVVAYAVFREIALELLVDPRFIQCHRSFIVNMQDISMVAEKEIVTRVGARIPISKNYRDAKNAFYQWKFGGDEK